MNDAEVLRLYADFQLATTRALEVLRWHGTASRQFRQADANAGAMWRRVKRALDEADHQPSTSSYRLIGK